MSNKKLGIILGILVAIGALVVSIVPLVGEEKVTITLAEVRARSDMSLDYMCVRTHEVKKIKLETVRGRDPETGKIIRRCDKYGNYKSNQNKHKLELDIMPASVLND